MTEAPGKCQLGIRPFTSGMLAWPCRGACPRTVLGSPRNVLTSGVPKPSLKPQSTQVIRTRQKVVTTISTVLIAHFFWTRPPYRTARAGMDISPTSVAAVICQELSPALSQLGYGFTMPPWGKRAFWVQLAGWLHYGRSVFLQGMCPMRGFREYFSVVTRPVTSAADVTWRWRGRSPGQPRPGRGAPGPGAGITTGPAIRLMSRSRNSGDTRS